MKFKLENFEQHFDDDDLIPAEVLFENSAVQRINEIEKHLWIAIIKGEDETETEVEILISPSYVRKLSCECEEFHAIKSCNHVIIGLFALRKHIQAKKDERAAQIAKARLPKKLRLADLIENVSDEELRSFVSSYLRKDRKLYLNFKARFAQKIEIGGESNKYLQILDELIKPISTKEAKLRAETISLFINLSNEFLAQFGDLMSVQSFSEALEILTALMKKSTYVLAYNKVFQDKVLNLVEQVHKAWWEYFENISTTELKLKQTETSSELASHSYYNYESNQIDLYQFLYKNSAYIENSVFESLITKIVRNDKLNRDCSYLISVFFKLLYKIDKLDLFQPILPILNHHPEFHKRILQKFFQSKEYDEMDSYIRFMKSHSMGFDKEFLSFEIRILIHNKESQQAIKAIRDEYILNHDRTVLLLTEELSEKDRIEVYAQIEGILLRQNSPANLMNLYNFTNQPKKLLSILKENPDIKYLDQYGDRFWEDHHELMKDLYSVAFMRYLDEHVGYSNSKFVATHLSRIKRKGWPIAAKEIKSKIQKQFPGRISLKQALQKF